jgi:hypothetical protein
MLSPYLASEKRKKLNDLEVGQLAGKLSSVELMHVLFPAVWLKTSRPLHLRLMRLLT